MQSIWISSPVLYDLCSRLMDGHIRYGFGSKAAFKTTPEDIKAIDCSGFVRYLIYHVTDGEVIMPDGSWNQNAWCKHNHLITVEFATAADIDGWLRIAFLPPKKGHAGHVWLILNGKTLESHGGVGPDRRPWDTPILKSQVKNCYKMAQTNSFLDSPIPGVTPDVMYA
jgi:hypothetical protein